MCVCLKFHFIHLFIFEQVVVLLSENIFLKLDKKGQ